MSVRSAVWALVALACAGCADEVETRPAAYPEPIGYTPPPPDPSEVATAAAADDDGTPPPAAAAPASADQDVVVDGAEPVPYAAPSQPAAEGDGQAAPAPPDDAQASGPAYGDADPAALSDFRGTLDPYGTWVDDPTYGTVWSPSASVVGDDFTPYVSAGHWAYDDDYVWVSDYSWGWAPFHYGRWVYVGGSGWVWIPGRRYAGAWVSWRYGEGAWGYVGWAPLPPTWCWHHGVPSSLGFVPRAPYSFLPRTEVFTPVVRPRLVAGPSVAMVAAHTRPFIPATPRVVGASGGVRLASGPPPSTLDIRPSSVVHTTPADRGVLQARAFATPRSAIALGARPPRALPTPAWQARTTTTLTGAAPQPQPSHFGGRLGAGFTGNAYASPPGGAPYARPQPVWAPAAAPNRGPVRVAPAPAYGGAPAYGPPVRTGPTPVFRPATPAAGYSPAPVRAAPAPVFRSAAPAAPSGGFHGGGSYGGFRGGGGGGGRSTGGGRGHR